MKLAVLAKTIYKNQEVYKNQILLIEDGILTSLNADDVPIGFKELKADIVCPGFLDLQIYGAGKSLFSADLSHESLDEMESVLLKQGCTGFLTTLATNSRVVFLKAIAVAKSYQPKVGNFLGLHLEGPFINPKKKGAHIEEFISEATVEYVKEIITRADGVVKMITIAPELQSAEVIDLLNEAGIVISVGHSMASFKEATGFLEKIPAATHLYNAMPPLHHRQPGLVGAIFSKRPYTSIVADGIHVDFEMIKLAKQILKDKLFLITDAVTACSHGPYQHVFNQDHYIMPEGTLSGSSLTMLKAIKNCYNHVNIPLDEIIRMATTYPANLINNGNHELNIGSTANMILLSDDMEIQNIILANQIYI